MLVLFVTLSAMAVVWLHGTITPAMTGMASEDDDRMTIGPLAGLRDIRHLAQSELDTEKRLRMCLHSVRAALATGTPRHPSGICPICLDNVNVSNVNVNNVNVNHLIDPHASCPACKHAFHVATDTLYRKAPSCPMCRAPFLSPDDPGPYTRASEL
jgi:hypothetical protein